MLSFLFSLDSFILFRQALYTLLVGCDSAFITVYSNQITILKISKLPPNPDNSRNAFLTSYNCSMAKHSTLFSCHGSGLLENFTPIWRCHFSQKHFSDLKLLNIRLA